MENALLIGLSRQMSLRRELDVVSNNIANINTTGFKAGTAVFEEFMMPGASHDDFRRRDRKMSFVHDRSTWHDFGQGAIRETGNPLDVAVDEKSFLVVQTPGGERYTRNGSFQINAQGQLVNSEGHAVLGNSGPIQFQTTDKDITISRDGTISVPDGVRGKLRVVTFENPQRLQKDGGSTFKAADDMQPTATQYPHVMQGALEQSNVKAVVEMTRMIEVSRHYTQIAGLLQQHGDTRRSAIERLAEVPA
ncbi:flagellar basal-body rod protein FlgF [Pseudorhodoplanes sp.]|uniref:flagellar basal-body rod protein FlgF n=1 Tax=Pseudorhodoplanes sp. TaxID=1934341 RepID=UPI002C460AC7|nr:flagellar basal-body rod protein FlgF [Pseudorhodoplanes sp.]HWV51566.1 flagellar basal-body rod protein FlgF [Pseudorhodoplanes sp.]